MSEAEFPSDYAKTLVDIVVAKIKNNSCTTIIAPHGFGKSWLFRYIAYNRKYRKRYPILKNTEFVYFDLLKVEETHENQSIVGTSQNNEGVMAILNLTKQLAEKFKISYVEIFSEDLTIFQAKQKLYDIVSQIVKFNRRKTVYIILDSVPSFLSREDSRFFCSFLKTFRDDFKGNIQYIFLLDNILWLDKVKTDDFGGLSYLLTQNISFAHLINLKETFWARSDSSLISRVIQKNSKNFLHKLDLLNQITGGYLPYARQFDLKKEITKSSDLSLELILASEELLKSLTQQQKIILLKVINNQELPKGLDLTFLMGIGIIKVVNGKPGLFSEIFVNYLKNYFHPAEI